MLVKLRVGFQKISKTNKSFSFTNQEKEKIQISKIINVREVIITGTKEIQRFIRVLRTIIYQQLDNLEENWII